MFLIIKSTLKMLHDSYFCRRPTCGSTFINQQVLLLRSCFIDKLDFTELTYCVLKLVCSF